MVKVEFEVGALLALVPGPLDGSCCSRRGRNCQGIYLKQKSINPSYNHALSGRDVRRRDGIPQFAVNENFSTGHQRGLCDAGLADQSISTGNPLIAPSLERDAHQTRRDRP